MLFRSSPIATIRRLSSARTRLPLQYIFLASPNDYPRWQLSLRRHPSFRPGLQSDRVQSIPNRSLSGTQGAVTKGRSTVDHRARFSTLNARYEDFLFAPVCEDANGMRLSVISALARTNVDPWEEATRLAAMPKAIAEKTLLSILDLVSGRSWKSPEAAAIAARLVRLLPQSGEAERTRDLALFNLAIDSKLRGCDVVALKVEDVAPNGYSVDRATVRQRKTVRPVRFELTEQTRQAVDEYIRTASKKPGEFMFTACRERKHRMTTRQYARLLSEWIASIGLDPHLFGTHSLRRTKATLIYRRTGNLRAVQLLLGHTKIESTVRYLGIEVDDALSIAEQVDL